MCNSMMDLSKFKFNKKIFNREKKILKKKGNVVVKLSKKLFPPWNCHETIGANVFEDCANENSYGKKKKNEKRKRKKRKKERETTPVLS